MKPSHVTRHLACVLGMILLNVSLLGAQDLAADPEGFIIANPADLLPPDGERRTTVLGDPSEPGMYVMRLTFEPGQGSRPHYHDQARYITVIEGTWWVASGAHADVYDPDSMRPVEAGGFLYQPPDGHHYDMAKDEAVTVQIMGFGPVQTTSIPQETN